MSKSRTDRSQALLHLGTDIEPAVEADFNRWCEGHVRSNLTLPGFERVRRFARKADYPGVGESPAYLTLYDLSGVDALESDAFAKHDQSVPDAFLPHLRFERAVYQQLGVHEGASAGATATAILHGTVDVADPAWHERFLAWYSEVHVPAVLEVPGMVGATRYVNTAPGSGGHDFCTLYEMENSASMAHPDMPAASIKGACPPELEPQRVAHNHIYEEFFRAGRLDQAQ